MKQMTADLRWIPESPDMERQQYGLTHRKEVSDLMLGRSTCSNFALSWAAIVDSSEVSAFLQISCAATVQQPE
jgi:hypothetical protein